MSGCLLYYGVCVCVFIDNQKGSSSHRNFKLVVDGVENGEKEEDEAADVGQQREVGLLQQHVLKQRKQGEYMKLCWYDTYYSHVIMYM